MRGDVEGWVVDRHVVGRDLHAVDHGHFLPGALFDGDGVARGRVEVDGGGGGHAVAGDAVLLGQHGQLVGADLVGRIAVGRDAVGAEEHHIHPAGAHQVAGRVVGDQMHGDAGLHQLPGGQARALQPRAGFVHPDMHRVALLPGGAHHTQGGAVVHRGQRAGVAVVQDVGAVRHHGRAVGAHAPVDGHVLIGQGLRLDQQRRTDVVHVGQRQVGGQVQQTLRGPGQVDRGGTGRVQHLLGRGQIDQQALPVDGWALLGGQGHGIAAGRADGRRAANHHVGDGAGHRTMVIVGLDRKLQGQDALVDHLHLAILPPNRAHGHLPQ